MVLNPTYIVAKVLDLERDGLAVGARDQAGLGGQPRQLAEAVDDLALLQ